VAGESGATELTALVIRLPTVVAVVADRFIQLVPLVPNVACAPVVRFGRSCCSEHQQQPAIIPDNLVTMINLQCGPSLTSALVGANCFVRKGLSFHSVTMSWAHAKS
jgi:hypothetical protein